MLNKRQEFVQVFSGAVTPKAFGAGIAQTAHEADIFDAFRSKNMMPLASSNDTHD